MKIRTSAWLLAVASLAACGGGAPADNGAGAAATGAARGEAGRTAEPDPCSFITAAEVAAITGSPVSGTARSGNACKYHAEPDDGALVEVFLSDGAKKIDVARKSMELLGGIGKKVGEKGGGTAGGTEKLLTAASDAPDVGDEALWGTNHMIYARKGEAFIEVTPPLMYDPATHSGMPLISRDKRRAMARAIAERVLANIKQ